MSICKHQQFRISAAYLQQKEVEQNQISMYNPTFLAKETILVSVCMKKSQRDSLALAIASTSWESIIFTPLFIASLDVVHSLLYIVWGLWATLQLQFAF